jgi:hypothetical protein
MTGLLIIGAFIIIGGLVALYITHERIAEYKPR